MMNRKGFEFSFGWIFAIIVGAVILFLAIYAVTKIVGSERAVQQSELAKELGTILNPLETGLEEGKLTRITFPSNTRMINGCSSTGNFGEQQITVMSSSGIGAEWVNSGVPGRYPNKYIFSSDIVEGKELNVLSKSFTMGFKIADIMFIWPDSESYCFVNPPLEIKEEILGLNPRNINITLRTADCKNGSIRVCFTGSGCDINVLTSANKVSKGYQSVYYEDSLLYGAIFSSPELYECQLKRLMKRTAELAELYKIKSQNLAPLGCPSNLESDLASLADRAGSIKDSSELGGIYNLAEHIGERNYELECKLF